MWSGAVGMALDAESMVCPWTGQLQWSGAYLGLSPMHQVPILGLPNARYKPASTTSAFASISNADSRRYPYTP